MPAVYRHRLVAIHMLFAAGTLESFSARTQAVYDMVKPVQPSSEINIYVAGHDPSMWEMALAHYAPMVFPAR